MSSFEILVKTITFGDELSKDEREEIMVREMESQHGIHSHLFLDS